jgi:hypothetical protein
MKRSKLIHTRIKDEQRVATQRSNRGGAMVFNSRPPAEPACYVLKEKIMLNRLLCCLTFSVCLIFQSSTHAQDPSALIAFDTVDESTVLLSGYSDQDDE